MITLGIDQMFLRYSHELWIVYLLDNLNSVAISLSIWCWFRTDLSFHLFPSIHAVPTILQFYHFWIFELYRINQSGRSDKCSANTSINWVTVTELQIIHWNMRPVICSFLSFVKIDFKYKIFPWSDFKVMMFSVSHRVRWVIALSTVLKSNLTVLAGQMMWLNNCRATFKIDHSIFPFDLIQRSCDHVRWRVMSHDSCDSQDSSSKWSLSFIIVLKRFVIYFPTFSSIAKTLQSRNGKSVVTQNGFPPSLILSRTESNSAIWTFRIISKSSC